MVSALIAAARWGECSISMLWVVGRRGSGVDWLVRMGMTGLEGKGREGKRGIEELSLNRCICHESVSVGLAPEALGEE